MEPSTPPRGSRYRDLPDTPATPRFGSFGDLQDQPRKPALSDKSGESRNEGHIHEHNNTKTPRHRRKRSLSILATPRQTPRKRRDREPAARHVSDPDPETDLLKALKAPDSHDIEADAQQPPHPHADRPPPEVPGIWYVFRGKRVFRPLPKGEEPMKPVTLFKDDLEKRNSERNFASNDLFKVTGASDSEADTDVEWG